MQDINLNQLNLKVNDPYEKDEKLTNFEPSNDGDVVNKAYLDIKLSKTEGQKSFIEKGNYEYKLRNYKQSEEVLTGRAVKTTIQILYGKGLFDNYDNADEVLKKLSTY